VAGASNWHMATDKVEWHYHRWITGRTFLIWICDGTFDSRELLNPEGHAFAEDYYDHYLSDFSELFAAEYANPYLVRNSRRSARRAGSGGAGDGDDGRRGIVRMPNYIDAISGCVILSVC
jgi:hypothetical protein